MLKDFAAILILFLALLVSFTTSASLLRASKNKKAADAPAKKEDASPTRNDMKDDWRQVGVDLDDDYLFDDDEGWTYTSFPDDVKKNKNNNNKNTTIRELAAAFNAFGTAKAMEPIIDGILERGFESAGPFSFGFSLRRAYQFINLPIPNSADLCDGNPSGTITGVLHLWLPEVGGWDTLTDITSWEVGSPRTKPTADERTQNWKVNFAFRIRFVDFYGDFNCRMDIRSDNCQGKYRLTQNTLIDDIEALEDDAVFNIILFARGNQTELDDGTLKVNVAKAHIQTVDYSYVEPEVRSQKLEQYAPWILPTSFNHTKDMWLFKEVKQYVVPAMKDAMNAGLKAKLPLELELAE